MDYSRFESPEAAPPPYVIQPAPRRPCAPRVYKLFRSTQAKVAGSLQIIAAVVAAIMASVALALHRKYKGEAKMGFFSSPAVWLLALYINAGAFTIAAAVRRTKCPIVASMVLSILCAVSSGIHLMMASCLLAAGVREMADERYYYNVCGTVDYEDWRSQQGSEYDYDYYGSGSGDATDEPLAGNKAEPFRETRSLRHQGERSGSHGRDGFRSQSSDEWDDGYRHYSRLAKAFIGISSMYILAAMVQFITAIWAAVICCKSVCCGRQASVEDAKEGMVVVHNAGMMGTAPMDTKAPLTGPVVVADTTQPIHVPTENKEQVAVDDTMPYPMVNEDTRDIVSPPPSYHMGSGFLGDPDTASTKSTVPLVDG